MHRLAYAPWDGNSRRPWAANGVVIRQRRQTTFKFLVFQPISQDLMTGAHRIIGEVAKSGAPEPGFEPVYLFKHWDDAVGKNIYSARPATAARIRVLQCTPIAESARLVPADAIDGDGFVKHDRLEELGIRSLTGIERERG